MRSNRKCDLFLSEPMGDKSVKDIPGVGPLLHERLIRAGITKAHQLYEMFLKKPNEREFAQLMKRTVGYNIPKACYKALKDYRAWGHTTTNGPSTSRAEPTTTKKAGSFITQPLGDKPITIIPGIGLAASRALKREGVTKAYQIFGTYLVCEKKEKEFMDWLMSFGVGRRHAKLCFDACENKKEFL